MDKNEIDRNVLERDFPELKELTLEKQKDALRQILRCSGSMRFIMGRIPTSFEINARMESARNRPILPPDLSEADKMPIKPEPKKSIFNRIFLFWRN